MVKEIGEYIARTYDDDAREFRTALIVMQFEDLDKPEDPDSTPLSLEVWKLDIKDYQQKTQAREKNIKKAFALILGQTSRAVQDLVEAATIRTPINQTSNVIGLLRLIRTSLYIRGTRRKPVDALQEAEERLHKFQEGEHMLNHEYLEQFKGLVQMV